jgi:SCO1/SenC
MRSHQWIWPALAGFLAFSTAALCTVYVASLRGAVGGAPVTASIGGPFTLIDDTGAPVTENTLAGKPYAMYFGYTFCPDVCPTTLLDLSRWIKKLGPDADRLNYVFVEGGTRGTAARRDPRYKAASVSRISDHVSQQAVSFRREPETSPLRVQGFHSLSL